MTRIQHTALLAALVAIVVLGGTNLSSAQRRNNFNFGGSNNNNNNSNRNKDKDQDDNHRNRNDGNRNSSVDQIQQMIQGGQGGQGNKNKAGNAQKFNNNQQGGQFGQGTQKQPKNQTFQQQFFGGQNNQNKSWQWQKYNKHNDLQQWVVGFNGGPQPFTRNWYKDHPNAWHHHHDNDNWQIATAAGVLGWLGWQNARPYNNQPVIVYDPVPVDQAYVGGQPGTVADINPADWMTLGAYTLMTSSGDPGTRIIELSVNKQGNIRGSYYDMITNSTNNVFGVIDQNNQQVRWTLDTNKQMTFATPLDQLTQPQGVVNVKLPGGQVQEWQLVRMENNVADNTQY